MTTIFLSYARGDDEPFVQRLYKDLINQDYDVWWDRVSMPSRQLTFHHEIRDAISERDRLILVIGPKAMQSNYVNQEWRWALEFGKGINPLLRLGDYDILPEELKLLDTQDFRDDSRYEERLRSLSRQLSEPLAPMGKLFGVPSLPPHFLKQPDRLRALKNTVLADFHKPVLVTGTAIRTGIQGMGGIGKSVLAAAFARDLEVRRAFPDGIFWIPLGQQPSLIDAQRVLAKALNSPGAFNTIEGGKAHLKGILDQRAVLLILDDLWDYEHADTFDIIGLRSRIVITSRDAGLVTALGATHYQLQLLDEPQALALMAQWAVCDETTLPPDAKLVMMECGRLPLALSICGAMVHHGTTWADILEALYDADLEFLDHPHGNLLKSIKASVDVLTSDQKNRFAELAVFPTDEMVPETTVLTLWEYTGMMKEREARQLLNLLTRRALVRLDTIAGATETQSARRASLHDLIHDYTVKYLIKDIPALHGQLVEAYAKKCPNGWPSGPDDGYYLKHLPLHLIKAGKQEDCVKILTDQGFFIRCWENNEYNIKIAWSLLEKEIGTNISTNYDLILLNPEKYRDDFDQYLAKLLIDTGNIEASIPLLKYLLKSYREQNNDKKLQNAISEYAWALYLTGKLNDAMRLFKDQEKICRNIQDNDGLQKCLIRMGNIHLKKGELEKAMELYRQQQKICEKIGNGEYLVKSLGNQGLIYETRGFPDKALKLYRQQEGFCRQHNLKDSLQKSLGNQGIILANRGEFKNAFENFKQQELICCSIGSKIGLQSALVNQGIICQHYGRLDKALELYKKQEEICGQIKYFEGLQNSYANQGSVFLEKGELNRAMELFKKQEELCVKINFMDGYQSSLCHQGEVLLQKDMNDAAMELFKKQEEICTTIENYDGLQQSLGYQGTIFEFNNELDHALTLYKRQEQICRIIKNSNNLQLSFGRQADIYFKKSQFDKAIQMYNKQEQICRKISNIKDLSKCLIKQAEVIILISNIEQNVVRRNNRLRKAQKYAFESYELAKRNQLKLTLEYIEPKYKDVLKIIVNYGLIEENVQYFDKNSDDKTNRK